MAGGSEPTKPATVAIIGAGVAGIATARAISLLRAPAELRIVIIEGGPGPLTGASRGNSAFIHSGFDCKPGTLEARFVKRGHQLFEQWVEHAKRNHNVDVPYSKCGALMLAHSDGDLVKIRDEIKKIADENGVPTALLTTSDAVAALEPALGTTVRGGLHIPDEWCVDPYLVPVMWLAEAVGTGKVDFLTGHRVTNIHPGYRITCATAKSSDVDIAADIVINCAGLHGADVDALRPWLDARTTAALPRFELFPRLGRFVAFSDAARKASGLRQHALLPLPTPKTKGVIVFLTQDGSTLICGPTAEDPGEVEKHDVVRQRLVDAAASRLPGLAHHVAVDPRIEGFTFAGKRPALKDKSDYFLDADREHRWITIAGIRSTGLSSSLALGEWAAQSVAALLSSGARVEFELPKSVTAAEALKSFSRVTHPISAAARRPHKL
jgi:glycerol-3-phosphate dehydrogenase